MPLPGETTDDTLFGGALRLRQPARGHRAGTDAVLLAAAADPQPAERFADIGAGTGAVGLGVAMRVPGATGVLVERDPDLAALACDNARLNGLADRVRVVAADILAERPRSGMSGMQGGDGDALPENASLDLVLTNPPFLEHDGASRASPDPARSGAHHLEAGGSAAWIGACARLLRPRGRLVMIHRADRVDHCLRWLSPAFGAVRLRLVHPRAGADATRVLIRAVKGARGILSVAPPLVLHDDPLPEAGRSRFTPETHDLHAGAPMRWQAQDQ